MAGVCACRHASAVTCQFQETRAGKRATTGRLAPRVHHVHRVHRVHRPAARPFVRAPQVAMSNRAGAPGHKYAQRALERMRGSGCVLLCSWRPATSAVRTA